MKIKTNELTGSALDRAVRMALGWSEEFVDLYYPYGFHPSTDWAQGGVIIEREELSNLKCYSTHDWDCNNGDIFCDGPTPLIAAMRCYVTSKLGDEVEVPDELKGE